MCYIFLWLKETLYQGGCGQVYQQICYCEITCLNFITAQVKPFKFWKRIESCQADKPVFFEVKFSQVVKVGKGEGWNCFHFVSIQNKFDQISEAFQTFKLVDIIAWKKNKTKTDLEKHDRAFGKQIMGVGCLYNSASWPECEEIQSLFG